MQSNAAVHLYKYATSEDYEGTGGNGHNYFTHSQEYFLLGFDRVRLTNENQDYIPDIASEQLVDASSYEVISKVMKRSFVLLIVG